MKAAIVLAVCCFAVCVEQSYSYSCPHGYAQGEHTYMCYKRFGTRLTYKQAEARCQHDGAVLAVPLGPDQNKAIAKAARGRAYIGVNDYTEENSFRITSFPVAEIEFAHWHKGEPNDWGHREDCVEINFGGFQEWNDLNCGTRFPFVCQTPL